jgi:PPOX class probable F420-dependent enzyme
VSRRDQIRLSAIEQQAFLEEHRVVVCATNGRSGRPHLMPLWYVLRDGQLWAWTYAKSQKVRNLERDPRATLQVQDGERYEELRGVMIEADVVIHRDPGTVRKLGEQLMVRHGDGTLNEGARTAVRAQAAKRVGLEFVTRRVASWDHGKLAGGY